jgi:GxxExxY protein
MKYEEITYKIISCAMEVHKKLGPGYPEYIYHRALIVEFKLQNVPFEDEFEIKITIKANKLEYEKMTF